MEGRKPRQSERRKYINLNKERNFQKRNRIGINIERTPRGWKSAGNKNGERNASV